MRLLTFQSIESQVVLKEDYVATDIAHRKDKASEAALHSSQEAYQQGVQRVLRDYDRLALAMSMHMRTSSYMLNFVLYPFLFNCNQFCALFRHKATRNAEICNNLLGLCHLQVTLLVVEVV